MTRPENNDSSDDSSDDSSAASAHAELAGLRQALDAAPADAALQRTMSAALRLRGDELGALAHAIAAGTLEAHAAGTLADAGQGLCDVGTGYFMKGEHRTAAFWYRLVLSINPDLASAWQNLAAIHADGGRAAEAEASRRQAYRIQRVFIEPAAAGARRVLVLCVGQTSGNVPVETLLPAQRCCRIKYAIDYAAPAEDAALPPFDLVFNAVGEPDVAAALHQRLQEFAQRCGRPLLNPPVAIARTQRHRLAELLGGLDGVALAPCIRIEGPPASPEALAGLLAGAGIGFPMLARPAATHGGEGLDRHADMAALQDRLRGAEGPHYLASFYDYRSADGCYRKYRIVFVDRQPFPYHMAISAHWMVHYFSSDMEAKPERIAEEMRFLQDPDAVLGQRAMFAVRAIGRRLDLDYAGIDFTLLPDGRVFVFEANATMLVHRERQNGALAHKNIQVQRIVDAFEALQARRLAG
jgi:tetratricopeptide (TPR) repeat protein